MVEEIEVSDVKFLTPALVTTKGGETYLVSIDLLSRKVYDRGDELTKLGKSVFEYLDSTMILPEDFFAASGDIQEKAQQAYSEIQKQKDEHVGGDDGWGSSTN